MRAFSVFQKVLKKAFLREGLHKEEGSAVFVLPSFCAAREKL